jgi:acyl-CoA thioester hydrolase
MPIEKVKKEQFSSWITMPVRWGDMDSLGHVNNAKFFTYDEQARLFFFEDIAKHDARFWKDYGLILAKIGCDFIQQVHFPATLNIGYRIVHVGNTSIKGQSGMFLEDTLVAQTESVIVFFDYASQKPMLIPDSIKNKLVS